MQTTRNQNPVRPSSVRRRARVLFLGAVLVFGCSVQAGPVNVTKEKIAVHGYDPVAYFVEGRPVPGTAELTFTWQGAIWRFASAENRAKFAKTPEKYAPQYGGYCAYAMADGDREDIDPTAFKIVAGKLYLNYDADIQKKWERKQSQMIQDGDKYWSELLARESKS